LSYPEYPVYENSTDVVGDYIIFSEVRYDEYRGDKSPLEEMTGGCQIHAGSKVDYRGFGEPSDFKRAVGRDTDYDGVEDGELEDYWDTAVLLQVLSMNPEDTRNFLVEALEADYLSLNQVDGYEEPENADLDAPVDFEAVVAGLSAGDVHTTVMTHVLEVVRTSYQRTAGDMIMNVEALARKLAEHAVEARVKGDEYAVPLSLGGHYDVTIDVEHGQSFLEVENNQAVWTPSDDQRADLAGMPYPQALERAYELAKVDAQLMSHWASGNVFDVSVRVYRAQYDDGGDVIEDYSEYESEEPIHEDSCGGYYGTDDAVNECNSMVEFAKSLVAEEMEKSRVASSPSM
jgi:hypothetical protein